MTAADVIAGKARWAADCADCLTWLRSLPDDSVHCWVTSPPYFQLRDYGVNGQIGLERTPDEFVGRLVEVFREAWRVLHPSGCLWLNMGDSYAGSGLTGGTNGKDGSARRRERMITVKGKRHCKRFGGGDATIPGIRPKNRLMIPARLAIALQADGWYLRDEIVWFKPNPMPLSVRDRTSPAHEMVYLLTKKPRYYFDQVAVSRKSKDTGRPMPRAAGWAEGKGAHNAIAHGGRGGSRPTGDNVPEFSNIRSVWKIATVSFKGKHYATFPPKLAQRCILAGSSARGVCPECGQPWRRIVERTRKPTRPGKAVKYLEKSNGDERTSEVMGWNRPNVIGNRDPQRHCTVTETLGWEPGCKCAAGEPVPAIVGDLFAGSGTTLAVAVDLGRRSIGCDLDARNMKLIGRRMAKITPPLFTEATA